MLAGRRGRWAALVGVVAVLAAGLALVVTAGGPGPARADDGPAERGARDWVTYAGDGVRVWRASGQLDRLSETSPAFRRFVAKQLNMMWREYVDADPACAQAPLVVVKEFRPRVAFISNQGTFPGGPGDAPDTCASGGAFHFYVKRDGEWRAPLVLGGQDVMRCRTLRNWDIPRMNGARVCWNGEDVVRYQP